jgi:hypothetical protein
MSNILLIEPSYRSKFPPLGLLRLSTYHKTIGDTVTFARGKVPEYREATWHRIYISSLFTYELHRTVNTIEYYSHSVNNPTENIIVGGIGATLLPQYIRDRVICRVIEGPLDKPNILGPNTPPIASFIPDYDLINSVNWNYRPEDSYFVRVTTGCIRHCSFCAVPVLEPTFGYSSSLSEQVREVCDKFGEKQHLVLLDNNLLASEYLERIISDIREVGFPAGAKRRGRKRTVDFNQGIDARLVTPKIAKLLATICLEPIRLAFDFDGMENQYCNAMELLIKSGFRYFTNYIMFNFNDTPVSLYHRLCINIELSQKYSVQVTSFPMRYIPIQDVDRKHVSKGWKWRYLRGLQCVMNATHGMVSPRTEFFERAFGKTLDEFLEILSMPDQYIIHRNQYKDCEAKEWKEDFRELDSFQKNEFLSILEILHKSNDRITDLEKYKKYNYLLEHYYPNGKNPHG